MAFLVKREGAEEKDKRGHRDRMSSRRREDNERHLKLRKKTPEAAYAAERVEEEKRTKLKEIFECRQRTETKDLRGLKTNSPI